MSGNWGYLIKRPSGRQSDKGMLHNVGGDVKVGRGPVWAKQGQNNIGTRVV